MSAVHAALERIAAENGTINAFTDVTTARAQAGPRAAGPLEGVPYAVKNLFDIEGLVTRAGAKINRERPPASADATLIQRLDAAGAVLVGGLNMGEYAYDFTGENAHDGACRNPRDTARMSGGSSSGSGAAVAAGFVPLALGSDTNGSIRVPASLCGVFGLKPTYGRLSRGGSFPFCDSLDHVGPLADSVGMLARAYDAMQGADPRDHACRPPASAPIAAALDTGVGDLRIAVAGGAFFQRGQAAAHQAVERVAGALAAVRTVDLAGIEKARAAAYLITNAESSRLHLPRLRARAEDFDPDTRDRFLAGALLPAAWLVQAQRVRRWWLGRMAEVFREVDVLLAPATPCTAPKIGQKTLRLGGDEVAVRPNLGLFTQPFSAIGLPVVAVPLWLEAGAGLPIGVQLIAPPWREEWCLRVARQLERDKVVHA